MKKLLLIRHAKAVQWSPEGDFGRGLSERGIGDCGLMSKRLARFEFQADLVIASSAFRTIETAQLMAQHLGWDPGKLSSDRDLYLASAGDILEAIRQAPDSVTSLAVVGHNPGISELYEQLSRGAEELPTCGMVLFETSSPTWAGFSKNPVKKIWVGWPKMNR